MGQYYFLFFSFCTIKVWTYNKKRHSLAFSSNNIQKCKHFYDENPLNTTHLSSTHNGVK